MKNKPSIFLFAGETSGDTHGGKLLHELKEQFPRGHFFGVGGPKMRTAGLDLLLPMEKFQVMGFVDVFFALPRLMKQFFFLRNKILETKPDLVILIDYPGFNLALAKSLRKHRFKGKVCQYICPSVWAWGKNRIFKMEKILDHLFVIFPFEKAFFDADKLNVNYVGHPLVKQIGNSSGSPLDIDKKKRVIAIFPGSREKELLRNFPLQIKVMNHLIHNFPDLFFVISVAAPAFSSLLDQLLNEEKFKHRDRLLFLDPSQNEKLMRRATLAIAKSGTNNLELALHGVPTVVVYGISPLDLFIAKNLLKINLPFYCIVNIIAKKQVFPELIGPNFTEENLVKEVEHLLTSEIALKECRKECLEIGKILENKTPEQEIATVVKNLFSTYDEKPI